VLRGLHPVASEAKGHTPLLLACFSKLAATRAVAAWPCWPRFECWQQPVLLARFEGWQ
jgi:hypothetical protein